MTELLRVENLREPGRQFSHAQQMIFKPVQMVFATTTRQAVGYGLVGQHGTPLALESKGVVYELVPVIGVEKRDYRGHPRFG